MQLDLTAMSHQVNNWHKKWCQHLSEWSLKAMGIEVPRLHWPTCHVKLRGGNSAGKYRHGKRECIYYLPYYVMEREQFEETVAHEVCHFFAKRLMPKSKWHGDLFFFLLRHVCGFRSAERCHHHNTDVVNKIAEVIKIHVAQGGLCKHEDTM